MLLNETEPTEIRHILEAIISSVKSKIGAAHVSDPERGDPHSPPSVVPRWVVATTRPNPKTDEGFLG